MTISTVVTAAAMGFVAYSLVRTVAQHRDSRVRRDYAEIVRAFRWWMIPANLGVWTLLVVVCSVLWQVPVLRFSWWKLVSGTDGSMVTGQSGFHGGLWTTLSVGIPAVLLLVLPILAYQEEDMFRKGSEMQSKAEIFVRQLGFGLIHCVFVGVPLAVGLALTLVGYFYVLVYVRHIDRNEIRRLADYIDSAVEIPVPSMVDPDVHALTMKIIALRTYERLAKNREAKARIDSLRREGLLVSSAAHATYNGILVAMILVVAVMHALAT